MSGVPPNAAPGYPRGPAPGGMPPQGAPGYGPPRYGVPPGQRPPQGHPNLGGRGGPPQMVNLPHRTGPSPSGGGAVGGPPGKNYFEDMAATDFPVSCPKIPR